MFITVLTARGIKKLVSPFMTGQEVGEFIETLSCVSRSAMLTGSPSEVNLVLCSRASGAPVGPPPMLLEAHTVHQRGRGRRQRSLLGRKKNVNNGRFTHIWEEIKL